MKHAETAAAFRRRSNARSALRPDWILLCFLLFFASLPALQAATLLHFEQNAVTVGYAPTGTLTMDVRVEDVTDVASILFDANDHLPGGPVVTAAAVGDWWSTLADYNFDSGPIPGGDGMRVLADLASRPDNSGESGSGAVAQDDVSTATQSNRPATSHSASAA